MTCVKALSQHSPEENEKDHEKSESVSLGSRIQMQSFTATITC